MLIYNEQLEHTLPIDTKINTWKITWNWNVYLDSWAWKLILKRLTFDQFTAMQTAKHCGWKVA